MHLIAALHIHQKHCEELHELMLTENRSLSAGVQSDDALLQRKRDGLEALSSSLSRLRELAKEHPATPSVRAAVEKTQQLILKALLLDRENEQLLLKAMLAERRPAVAPPRPAPSQLARIYAGHA